MLEEHIGDLEKQQTVTKGLFNIQEVHEIGNADMLAGTAIFIATLIGRSPMPEEIMKDFFAGLEGTIKEAMKLNLELQE